MNQPDPFTNWRKSSLSSAGDNCVEVATAVDGRVAVRNSRHPHQARLIFTPGEWSAFVGGVAGGEFGRLPVP